MGKDMAAGNTPEGNKDNLEIILDPSKFNFYHFDNDGCIKLEVLMWLCHYRFATTSLK